MKTKDVAIEGSVEDLVNMSAKAAVNTVWCFNGVIAGCQNRCDQFICFTWTISVEYDLVRRGNLYSCGCRPQNNRNERHTQRLRHTSQLHGLVLSDHSARVYRPSEQEKQALFSPNVLTRAGPRIREREERSPVAGRDEDRSGTMRRSFSPSARQMSRFRNSDRSRNLVKTFSAKPLFYSTSAGTVQTKC